MSSNLSITPPAAEGPGSDGREPPRQARERKAAAAPEPEAPPTVDPGQRLIIEETAQGGLVYTVIDRASGAVLARISREDVTQMGLKPDYAAGALIRAKA